MVELLLLTMNFHESLSQFVGCDIIADHAKIRKPLDCLSNRTNELMPTLRKYGDGSRGGKNRKLHMKQQQASSSRSRQQHTMNRRSHDTAHVIRIPKKCFHDDDVTTRPGKNHDVAPKIPIRKSTYHMDEVYDCDPIRSPLQNTMTAMTPPHLRRCYVRGTIMALPPFVIPFSPIARIA